MQEIARNMAFVLKVLGSSRLRRDNVAIKYILFHN